MSRSRVLLWLAVVGAIVAFVAAACGGSDKNYNGEAARAVALYWQQEADAGTLPEGTLVRGQGTQTVSELAINSEQDDAGVKARMCVEFQYIRAESPFDSHKRVYVASLIDDAWSVEVVNPDGTCDGVA